MKNCFDCKHCVTLSLDLADWKQLKEYQENKDQYVELSSPIYSRVGKCLQGHNLLMKNFREEHGTKTRTEIEANTALDMPCYEMTEGARMLQDMIDKTQQIIGMLTEAKKENTDPI